jgi:hypothetical protein
MKDQDCARRAARSVIKPAILALAVVLAGCDATLPVSSLAAVIQEPVATPVPTVDPTPRQTPEPTVSPRPTTTPLPFIPVDADDFKDGLIHSLGFTCPTVGGSANQRLWTCSYRDDVAISVYGPSPARVSAIRVVTGARQEVNRRSWLRGYASIISVEVFQWVDDHFGTNDSAAVGGVWMQMTHDATSDGVLISTGHAVP